MVDWIKQRNLILSAWPVRLASGVGAGVEQERKNQTVATTLLDMAITCSEEKDWRQWKDTLLQHWPVEQPSVFRQLSEILGPSLTEGLALLLDSYQIEKEKGQDPDAAEKFLAICRHFGFSEYPSHPAIIHDPSTQEQARILCEQYHLAGIDIWASLLGQAKSRVDELRMAMSNLALASSQDNSRIGRGHLVVVLAGKVQVPNVSGNRLELPDEEQGLARGWCQWRMEKPTSQSMLGLAEREWTGFLRCGERGKMARQRMFMLMTQHSLRRLAGSLVDRTNAGELALRRYRAASKWMNEATMAQKDNESLLRGWRKVKTGNRIAWTGLASGELGNDPALRTAIDNWQWEDRILEAAFWRMPQWCVPAWLQRFYALGSESWPEDMDKISGRQLHQAWAFAFEGMIRDKMGYDSSAAKARPSHPVGFEARQMEEFFNQHLSWIIYA